MADQDEGQAPGDQGLNPETMMNSSFPLCPNGGAPPVYGYVYPAWILTMQPQPQPHGVYNQMGVMYAGMPTALTYMGSVPHFYPGGLVPLTYTVPCSSNPVSPVEENTSRVGEAAQDATSANRRHEQHRSPHGDLRQRREELQRQRILRLIICFQFSLLLMLKFAMAIFLFKRSGSKERLRLMMIMNMANFFYLYQMGAFDPLLRWLSRNARRAMTPAQRPANTAQVRQSHARQTAYANDHHDLHWQGLQKEVQMIVVGFVASLFPGFRLSD